MKSQPRRPSSVRKLTAIVDAAATVFVRDGYDPASMDEIAELAGVSKQTMYAYFESKEGLFVAVIQSETQRAFQALRFDNREAVVVDLQSLRTHLQMLGEALLDVILTPRMIGLRRLAVAESHRFPAPAAAFAQGGYERSVQALTEMFTRHFESGLIAGDPHDAAQAFVVLVVVGPVDRAMFGAPPLEGKARTEHVAGAVRLLLAGIKS